MVAQLKLFRGISVLLLAGVVGCGEQQPPIVDAEPPAGQIQPVRQLDGSDYNGPTYTPQTSKKDTPLQVGRNANQNGAWSALRDWPLIAIHASMLPDGRVVTFGTDGDGKQTGRFIYDIWDSTADSLTEGHLTLPNTTQTDIFCASQTLLPLTGDLFINGGDIYNGEFTENDGNPDTNVLSMSTNQLIPGNQMNRARWYSTVTTLPDGSQYIQGGQGGGADHPEIRDLNGNFKLLSGADTLAFDDLYPRNFLAPDGRIFGFDADRKMYFVDPTGDGYVDRLPNLDSELLGDGTTAVMFEPNKILLVGANRSNRAVVIDISGPLPEITPTSPVSGRRIWLNSTVLPDGKVLVTGGSAEANELVGVNNSAEIWDPATGNWSTGAAGAVARLYHSSALLLSDATVLVAGGGASGPVTNTNAELYYPPYLFGANGARAVRPEILSAPTVVDPGGQLQFQVDNGAQVSRVALIRTGSSTHSVDFDQRHIPLSFQANGNTLIASLPANGAILAPGFYQLFVLNGAGVPSVAKILRVNIGSADSTAMPWTGRIGGIEGEEFVGQCQSNEVMVGVHGLVSGAFTRIGPRCVQVGSNGGWSGDPVNRVGFDGPGGDRFARTCQRGMAIAGFSGRSDATVSELTLACRDLTGDGRLTGSAVSLNRAIAASGGTRRDYRSCGGNSPVRAMYGRAAETLNAFGLLCDDAQPYINPIAQLDFDNDGTPDTVDAFPRDASEAFDTDGDGIGNTNDADDDNDGLADANDRAPLDAVRSTENVCHQFTDRFDNGVIGWARDGTVNVQAAALAIDNGWVSRLVPVKPNARYRLTGSYSSSGGPKWAGLGIDFINDEQTTVRETIRTLALSAGATQSFDLAADVSSDVSMLRVWFYAGTGRTLILDDIDMRLDGCTGNGDASTVPFVASPGPQLNVVGEAVSLPLLATDSFGNSLGAGASSVPAGLTLDNGALTGQVSSVQSRNVAVSTSDNGVGANNSFSWTVIEPLTDANCTLIGDVGFDSGLSGWAGSLIELYPIGGRAGNTMRFDDGWAATELSVAGGVTLGVTGRYLTGDTKTPLTMGLDYLDSSRNEIGEQVRQLVPAQNYFANFSVIDTAPAGTATVRVWFHSTDITSGWLDYINVRPLSCQ